MSYEPRTTREQRERLSRLHASQKDIRDAKHGLRATLDYELAAAILAPDILADLSAAEAALAERDEQYGRAVRLSAERVAELKAEIATLTAELYEARAERDRVRAELRKLCEPDLTPIAIFGPPDHDAK